jgi:hypothetical protein
MSPDYERLLFNPALKATSRHSALASGSSVDALAPYPWLRACIEDYALAARLSLEPAQSRHAVCLMHDAIEFLLYEILLLTEHDIYNDGQHTIGFRFPYSVRFAPFKNRGAMQNITHSAPTRKNLEGFLENFKLSFRDWFTSILRNLSVTRFEALILSLTI